MLRLVPVVPLFLAAAAAEDPCACLNWKPLYEGGRSDSAKVWCGEGREFAHDNLTLTDIFFAYEIAHGDEAQALCDVYSKMEDNYCVNSAWYVYDKVPEEEKRQWCYVSSECQDLNGGRVLPNQDNIPTFIPSWAYAKLGDPGFEVFQAVSKYLHYPKVLRRNLAVKYCGAKDKKTRDLPVPELAALAEKYDVRTDFLVKMAYAVARKPHRDPSPLWEDVRDHLSPGKKDSLPEAVLKAMQNKEPLVLDTDAHSMDDSVRVIVGSEVHKIDSPCEEHKSKDEKCPTKRSAKHFQYRKGHDAEL